MVGEPAALLLGKPAGRQGDQREAVGIDKPEEGVAAFSLAPFAVGEDEFDGGVQQAVLDALLDELEQAAGAWASAGGEPAYFQHVA